MRVALLGTGTMGAGMARNLLSAGHGAGLEPHARARRAAAADGATVHDTPAGASPGPRCW